MTIGDRIKHRREELNMSVDQLASKLGKNRATIYRYEKDEIENFPTTVLEPLAKALSTTPAYLMGWEDEKNETNPKDSKTEYFEFLFNLIDRHATESERTIQYSYKRLKELNYDTSKFIQEIINMENSRK